MSDNSISRIYQFLTDFNKENGDWREVADVNNNGVVIKTEFRNFMLNNFDWNGEESNKDDIINKFWKTVDTNTSGKISGTKTKNKNALSSDELDKMDVKIQIFEKMNEFVKANVNASESGVTNKSAWLKSVKESLGSYIEQYVKNGGTLEGVEEFLAQKLPIAKSMASANYYAQEYLKSDEIKALVPENYKGQGTIQKIIDAFVTSLKEDDSFQSLGSDSARLDYIKSKVKEIVKDYLSTADLCSGNPDNLGEYGYYTDGALNDIQEAVLVDTMGKSIQSYLEETAPEVCTKENEERIQSAVNNYISNKLKGASYDDFQTLKNFNASEIEDDDDFLDLIAQLKDEFEELDTARQSLKDYCAELVARNNEKINDAIKKVFGSMDYAARIDKCKDVAAVQALEDKIKTRISELDQTTISTEVSDINVSLMVGETKDLDSLPTTYTSVTGETIPTNEIEYRSSGSHVQISGSSAKVVAGNAKGSYVEYIEIYMYGKKVNQVKVSINVESISGIVKKASFNGVTDSSDGHLEVFNCMGIKDDTQTVDSNFADLYNGDAIICLHRGRDRDHGLAFERLDNLASMILSALTTAGLDADILKTAIKNVSSSYKNNYQYTPDIDQNKEGSDLCRYLATQMQSNSASEYYSKHAIITQLDDKRLNYYVNMVSFKNFVDDILAEYEKLSG